MEQIPEINIGDWVVLTEDGLWAMDSYTFQTKKDAIEEVSAATLDTRTTPKVKRLSMGYYLYFPKDVDTGTFGESYGIRRVTDENIEYIRTILQEQWESDPLNR